MGGSSNGSGLAGLDVLLGGGLDVRSVDTLALGDARELVLDSPEETEEGETKHGPGKGRDGGNTRALLEPWLELGVDLDQRHTALEAVAEGSAVEETSNGSKEDGTREEHESKDTVAEAPVEEAEEKVENGGKKTVG